MKPYLVILSVLALAGVGMYLGGQTTTGIAPFVAQQYLDNSGRPLVGGLVYTYAAGTTTPLASYTDSTGGTPNANPVVLDSAGRASIWMGASTYKFVIKTSAGVTVRTIDGVSSPTLNTASITIPSGQTFTMAAGSTSAFSTALLPGTTNTYNIGSAGARWSAAWINSLTLNNNLVIGTNNTYDIGTSASAFRNAYQFNGYTNIASICDITTGAIQTGLCYSLTPTVSGPGTDSLLTLKDETGAAVWAWRKKIATVALPAAITYTDIIPSTDAVRSIGSTGLRFVDGNFTGTVTASIIKFGGGIPLASLGAPPAGTMIYCSDCAVGNPCFGPGTGAWAFRIVTGPAWNCPF